jgi:Ala-tRNA(Pro) deacylase
MTIARTIESYLNARSVSYETLHHPHSRNSEETADSAFIWEDQLAKTVLLEDETGYLLAVVPASCRVDLRKIEHEIHRKLVLAAEEELSDLFPDCELGALPPFGRAYGIPTIYDDRLRKLACIYFEGGDHCDLVYMGGPEFIDLMHDAMHCDLCQTH